MVAFFSLALKTIKIPVMDTMSKSLQRKLGKLADEDNDIVAYLIGQLGRSSDYDKSVINGKKMLQDCYDLIGSAGKMRYTFSLNNNTKEYIYR